jgi:hypothetical protein
MENVKIFKDERAPHLSFHYKGGFSMQIFEGEKNIGGFSLPSDKLSDEELQDEISTVIEEQGFIR